MGAHYLLSHASGIFLLDATFASVGFCGQTEDKDAFLTKHKDATLLVYPTHAKEIRKAMQSATTTISRSDLVALNLERTKEDMRGAIKEDILIIQTVKSISDLDKAINSLTLRLRDWYELYLPEYSNEEKDQLLFAKGVVDLSKEEYSQEKGIKSFGSNFEKQHIDALKRFGKDLASLHGARLELQSYLKGTMEAFCPNLNAIAGTLLGAKLIEHSGNMRRLAGLPSSTVQILGAEKALFRHLKTGARPPKYGVLFAHDLVQSAPKGRQGRAARILANKISIAIRLDYFKGEFKGDTLLADAKKKINQ